MFIPVMETGVPQRRGPARSRSTASDVIPGFAYSAPYEDLRLRKK